MGVGPGQGRKGSGGSNHNRWQKGVDVQILFGVECVDKMSLQAMLSNVPASLYGKCKQAIAAKSGDWSTGSSGSGGEEERKARSLEAENKEHRARIGAMGKKVELRA